MAASTTPAGQAAAAGLQRAASTRLGQAAMKFGSAAAANIDRGVSAGASYAAAGVTQAGRMAASPVTNAGAAVKDAWSQGVTMGGGVSPAASSPPAPPTPSPERLEAGRQRFSDAATVAKATTTALKGATTTSGGGSGNPTIAPTNDES